MTESVDNKQSETYRGLLKAGGVSAFIAVLFALVQGAINGCGVASSIPVPTNVIEWFALLQSNRLFGLAALTFFEVPCFAFVVPVLLALCIKLRRTNRRFMTIGTSIGIVGITIFLATNSALSLSQLSDQYATATTDVQRFALLGAGQAVLTTYQVVGINIGVLLLSVSILMVSAVLLQRSNFNKVTGFTGVLASVTNLAYYPISIVTPGSIYVLILSGAILIVWLILVGRQLLKLQEAT